MHIQKIQDSIFTAFDSQFMPAFIQYLRVPNQSPEFDPHWEINGFAEKATNIITDFYKSLKLKGATIQVIKHPKRTHFIFITIQGASDDTILYYAHYDKQPPMDEKKWTKGKPYEPTIINNKLYARGSVDDGYGCFIIGLAIQALQGAHINHSRIVLIFESSEESLSSYFDYYATLLEKQIGDVKFAICMDEGCFDYEHLWNTTSVRGNTNVTLNVKYLKFGVHSGLSGMTTDPFNICRIILDRVQNAKTGEVIKELDYEITEQKIKEYNKVAEHIGNKVYDCIPILDGSLPYNDKNIAKMLFDITYKPTLTVTGIDGFPSIQMQGM
jgi:acetylornithine deacetylase/succinyl-diaminopimelate desuccinylase-like protein